MPHISDRSAGPSGKRFSTTHEAFTKAVVILGSVPPRSIWPTKRLKCVILIVLTGFYEPLNGGLPWLPPSSAPLCSDHGFPTGREPQSCRKCSQMRPKTLTHWLSNFSVTA